MNAGYAAELHYQIPRVIEIVVDENRVGFPVSAWQLGRCNRVPWRDHAARQHYPKLVRKECVIVRVLPEQRLKMRPARTSTKSPD